MLLVRDVQLQSMRAVPRRAFEDRLLAHAERWFPDVCAACPDALSGLVQQTVDRARSHGFETQRDVCKFLNLQCQFGWEFDSDPAVAWAQPLLQSSLPGPAKMERLYALALTQLQATEPLHE